MINILNSDITGIELSGLSISEVRFGDILVWPDGTPPTPPTPTPVTYNFALVPSSVTVQSGETVITLTENGYTPEWSIQSLSSWLNYLGEYQGRISLSVQENNTVEERQGSLALSYVSDSTGGTQTLNVSVTQRGPYRITYHSTEMLTPNETLVPYILEHRFSNGYGEIFLDTNLTALPEHSFYNSTEPVFTEMTLPNGLVSIGSNSFELCTSLSSVTIPDTVTSIDYGAFLYCRSLTAVTLPSGLTTIGGLAFSSTHISAITIPDTITYIGNMAFLFITNLSSITILATTPPTIGTLALGNHNEPIYVPADSVDIYKSTWTDLAERIQPIT